MNNRTKKIVGVGLMSAIVIVLQALAVLIRPTGLFSISLVLIPIVVGAALYGWKAGAWLGFVFAATVMLTGDANAFLAISPVGTILTVAVKGILAGLLAGLAYKTLEKKNSLVAVIFAAFVCPIVNTGVFLIGCKLFFMDTITQWAGGSNVGTFMIVSLVGVNFLIEMGINMVLSPIIVRIVNIGKKTV